MGLEAGTYLNDLVAANPLATDPRSQGDDHLRLIKSTLQATLPGMAGRIWRLQSKGGGYTVAATDNMTIIRCTAAITLALTAVATIGNGFAFVVQAAGGAVTIDPNSTEQINGGSTLAIVNGSTWLVFCDGSVWYAYDLTPIVTNTNLAKLDVENQALTGGVTVTSKSLGTISSGTLTLDMGDRPLQHYTNNGAHTLAPGSVVGAICLDITNAAAAGATTTTGWTKVTGDSLTTTNGHKFRCHASVGDAGSLLNIKAMQ